MPVQEPDAAGLHDELHALAGSLARLQTLLPAQQAACGDQELAVVSHSSSNHMVCSGDDQLSACAAGLSQLCQVSEFVLWNLRSDLGAAQMPETS